MATTSPSIDALQTAAPLTTARLREQAQAAEAQLDWAAAAELWRLARERYPLMPGRKEHGPLALADMENMRRFEATCRAMAEERAAEARKPETGILTLLERMRLAVLKSERIRIRKELISAFDDGQIVWYRDLVAALDRIIPKED